MGILDCCKCISFFGIFFYIAMGLIIFGQSEFLRFRPEDKMASVGACFVTALIQLIIVLAIIFFQRWDRKGAISRENYYDLKSQREMRPKQAAFKQIALGDLKMMRQENRPEALNEQ